MTADELMRLVSRYVEACDDLGDGLFEKPLTTTDDLHAKATGLHKQILDEVYRLHADVAQARQTAEYWKAEHLAGNARIGELHDELAATALRSAGYLRSAIKAESHTVEPLRRLWPLIERSVKGYVFTSDKAGEVAADMAALRKAIES